MNSSSESVDTDDDVCEVPNTYDDQMWPLQKKKLSVSVKEAMAIVAMFSECRSVNKIAEAFSSTPTLIISLLKDKDRINRIFASTYPREKPSDIPQYVHFKSQQRKATPSYSSSESSKTDIDDDTVLSKLCRKIKEEQPLILEDVQPDHDPYTHVGVKPEILKTEVPWNPVDDEIINLESDDEPIIVVPHADMKRKSPSRGSPSPIDCKRFKKEESAPPPSPGQQNHLLFNYNGSVVSINQEGLSREVAVLIDQLVQLQKKKPIIKIRLPGIWKKPAKSIQVVSELTHEVQPTIIKVKSIDELRPVGKEETPKVLKIGSFRDFIRNKNKVTVRQNLMPPTPFNVVPLVTEPAPMVYPTNGSYAIVEPPNIHPKVVNIQSVDADLWKTLVLKKNNPLQPPSPHQVQNNHWNLINWRAQNASADSASISQNFIPQAAMATTPRDLSPTKVPKVKKNRSRGPKMEIDDKLALLVDYDDGVCMDTLCQLYDCSMAEATRICNQKEKLRKIHSHIRLRPRHVNSVEFKHLIERVLCDWMKQHTENKLTVYPMSLKFKAQELKTMIPYEDFNPNDDWLVFFMTKYYMYFSESAGEHKIPIASPNLQYSIDLREIIYELHKTKKIRNQLFEMILAFNNWPRERPEKDHLPPTAASDDVKVKLEEPDSDDEEMESVFVPDELNEYVEALDYIQLLRNFTIAKCNMEGLDIIEQIQETLLHGVNS